jgi:hypothetical protein
MGNKRVGTRRLVPLKNHLTNPYRLKKRHAEIALTDKTGAVVAWVKLDRHDLKPMLFSRRWRRAGTTVPGAIGCHWAKDRRRGCSERMGRVILDAQAGERVRHRNGDPFDCRRSNLELRRKVSK